MPKFVPVSRADHAQQTWRRPRDYRFAAQEVVVPIVGAEMSRAALAMPLGFNKVDNRYHLIALLGVRPNRSLYVAPDGHWLGLYVPSALRGYPFRVARQQGEQTLILCVDEQSEYFGSGDEIFFDAGGKASKATKDMLGFLEQVERSRSLTDLAVGCLADAGVIEPWDIKVPLHGQEVPVGGVFRVSEVALNALDDGAFLTLRKTQALAIAYAQLLSMNQLSLFARLSSIQDKLAKTPTISPEDIFRPIEDDILRFD